MKKKKYFSERKKSFCNTLYLNLMKQTFDILKYEFCKIKYKSNFKISKVYTIKLQRYMDSKIQVCGQKLLYGLYIVLWAFS